uniref:Uncharacterized protein n=1 Tax=Xiphophorus couchianus TaxID=32473 RepID=A0A3B5L9V1_9TELE
MHWRGHVSGLAFSFVFTVSYFTNKFVLSVLKFTYPTLFQGWQTFIGAALLLLSGKLGWVEMSRIPRSAALSWLPGSFLFVGNIYAGSRALSRIVSNRSPQRTGGCDAATATCLVTLRMLSSQFDHSGYVWALCHLFCVGKYAWRVCIYIGRLRLPAGDVTGALEFPSLQSHTFHCGCCASALLGFLLLLATVRLKRGPSLEHFRAWVFLSKVNVTKCPTVSSCFQINRRSFIWYRFLPGHSHAPLSFGFQHGL